MLAPTNYLASVVIGSEGRRHRQHRQFAEDDHAIGHRSLQHFYEDDISLYVNYDDISSVNTVSLCNMTYMTVMMMPQAPLA